MLTFYCFPTWNTCRKAKAWLSEKNVDFKYRDILKNPPDENEVHTLAKLAGLNARELINPKSSAFKELGIDKESLSPKEAAEIIATHPKAMFRPILTDGNQAVVGFKTEEMIAWVTI